MTAEALASIVAALRDISSALAAGGLFAAATIYATGPVRARVLSLARWSAAVWALSAVTFTMVSYAVIDPTSVERSAFGEEVWWFLTNVPLGQAHLQVAIAAVLTSLTTQFVESRTQVAWALAPIAWAYIALAVTGHSAGASDHHLATAALFVHVVGAALWVGVVVALVVARPHLGKGMSAVVRRTSRVAAWAVLLVAVSGVANGAIRLGGFSDLWLTPYGRLLAVKIVVTGLLLLAGAWYRTAVLGRLSTADVRARFWRILMVDAGLLVLVTALAALLARTAPPVTDEPVTNPTPAWRLTGYELPPEPTFATWFTLWRLEIVTALAIAVAAVVYVRWVRRLRARGDTWPWYRTASWLIGLALLTWATQGGPAIYGMVTFSGHMIEHMIFVSMVPVPLALGAPVTLALRALPPRDDGSRGPREWLRAFLESWPLRTLAHPVVAAVNFAGSMFVFYYSGVFEWVLQNHVGHVWMAVHFVAVGYFFVNALIGVDPGPRRPRHPMRLVLLFATMAFHAFFGVALMMSESLLAPRWFGLMGREWGPDALADQQLGGQIAWGMGEIPVFLLAIAVVGAWKRADVKDATRADRQEDRNDDEELRRYNEMLARLGDTEKRR